MKKAIAIASYVFVILLILSTNQSRWFGRKGKDESTIKVSKPLLNSASAFVRNSFPLQTDPDMYKSWALKDNSVLQIKKAWGLGSCSKQIVIAIIDTGIDYNHPDLKENLWKNPNEIPNNGKDDDLNGLIDDTMGWDFVSNDNLPYDHHGHGTHVAGIIGAVGSNGIGISGVCPNVSLMILKYYDPKASGRQNLKNSIQAFQYAVNHHVHIINYSGGGVEYSQAEKNVIEDAEQRGILVVAAAGNEKQNTDIYGYYPASYDLKNIISVAALGPSKKLVRSSNYGIQKIDLAAPGKNIYSTLPRGKYGYMTGTSQATAFVSGIAALALSQNPSLPLENLKSLLIRGTIRLASLRKKVKTGGAISAYSVLKKMFSTSTVTTQIQN